MLRNCPYVLTLPFCSICIRKCSIYLNQSSLASLACAENAFLFILVCLLQEVQELAMLSDCQSDRMVSLLVSLYEQEELDCVLRLCGLQKIQVKKLSSVETSLLALLPQRAAGASQTILAGDIHHPQAFLTHVPGCEGKHWLRYGHGAAASPWALNSPVAD